MNGRIDNSRSGRSRSGMPIWGLLRILVLAGAAAGLSPGPTLGQLPDADGAVVDPQIFADIAQSPHGTVHVLVALAATWAPDADVAHDRQPTYFNGSVDDCQAPNVFN